MANTYIPIASLRATISIKSWFWIFYFPSDVLLEMNTVMKTMTIRIILRLFVKTASVGKNK